MGWEETWFSLVLEVILDARTGAGEAVSQRKRRGVRQAAGHGPGAWSQEPGRLKETMDNHG